MSDDLLRRDHGARSGGLLCLAGIAAEALWAGGCTTLDDGGGEYRADVPLGHFYADVFCFPTVVMLGPALCVIAARSTRLRQKLRQGARVSREPRAVGYRDPAKGGGPSPIALDESERRHLVRRELTASVAAVTQLAVGLVLFVGLAAGSPTSLFGLATVFLALVLLSTAAFLWAPRGRIAALALPLPVAGLDVAAAYVLQLRAATVMVSVVGVVVLWILVMNVRKTRPTMLSQ